MKSAQFSEASINSTETLSKVCKDNVRELLLHDVTSFSQVVCYYYRCMIDVTQTEIIQFCSEVLSIRYSKMHLPPARCRKFLRHHHYSKHGIYSNKAGEQYKQIQ